MRTNILLVVYVSVGVILLTFTYICLTNTLCLGV